ncbi:MAG: DoxX family protein [Ktedonobacteraceae bacterium]
MYKSGKMGIVMHGDERTGLAAHTWNRWVAAQFAPLVLRLVLGLIFLVHGLSKFTHMASSVAAFTKIGMPLPSFTVLAIAVLEVFGGLVIILGLSWITRVLAFLLALEMLVAILFVKLKAGLVGGYEFELVLLAALLALVFSGPGRLALWHEKEAQTRS